MKVAISSDFFTALAKLPKAQMNKTIKLVEKFKNDPTSSGLNYEKLHFSQDGRMHSLRVDQTYRCIVLKPESGDVYLLLWVDHHDEAYDWAKRHSCSIHPETGSLQIIETEYITEEVVIHNENKEVETVFSNYRDRELLRLGVPEQLISTVKQINSEDELDNLRKSLPEEAYEGLFYILAGDSYEDVLEYLTLEQEQEIDTENFAKALENENSKRRFYIVDENDVDLMSMLNAPLEKWRVFLHPSQRKLVNRNWNGPVRVLGGAGTGKTVAAMHRAKWLASNLSTTDGKILFTTFTKNLATDIYENLKKICSDEVLTKIEVKNLDQWVYEFLYKNGYQETIVYSDETDKLWEDALLVKSSSIDLPDSFFKEEWERVIQPQSVNSLQDYIKASRTGRGTRLNRAQRKDAWEVFEEYKLMLSKRNFKEPSDAMRDARILIEQEGLERPYSSVVVDEAQDFSAQAFMLLRALVEENKNDLFIVGDAHQRIYGHKVVLGQCGIKIIGRSRKLKLNYRTTDEVRKWAVKLFNGNSIDDLDDGLDTQNDYKSLYHGPKPEVIHFDNQEDEINYIAQYLQSLQKDEEDSKICVVLRTNKLVKEYQSAIEEKNVKTVILTKDAKDDLSDNRIRIATMHRVKGLDFDHVVIASVNDGIVPFRRINQSSEDLINQEVEIQEKSLLFVSATRAKKTLLVSSYGKQSKFLKEMEQ